MPLDEKVHANAAMTAAAAAPASAIENEIPAYRAISAGAVVSLVLGIVSVLCYASQFFLSTAIAAVLFGALAVRKIRRMPDILTGEKLAQAGIVLGLVFGITSYTITTMQGIIRVRAASAFARTFEYVLNKGTLDDAVWYSQAPDSRRGVTPAKLVIDLKTKGGDARMYEMQTQTLQQLKKVLGEPGASTRFRWIEGHADDGESLHAYALFQVDLPERTKASEKVGYALAIMQAKRHDKQYEWWVTDIKYPYTPETFVAPEKPVDDHGDGHGH